MRGSASQECLLAMFPTKVLVTQPPLDPSQKNCYHELLLKIEKQHSMHSEAMTFLFAGICKIWDLFIYKGYLKSEFQFIHQQDVGTILIS